MSITVYSTGPSCHKCRFTVSQMNKQGVVHDYVDLVNDEGAALPDVIQALVNLVHWPEFAPFVVITDEAGEVVVSESWNDARPDKVSALAASLAEAQAA